MKVLVSAGEASGDLYAAALATHLRHHFPQADFFGCTGPRMRAAGVRTVVDAASLNVVGLVEVLRHIPRILREFRKLVHAARHERPDLAILTDSPDFHLRLAPKLRALGIPVVYLIAPQVWAWREGRVKLLRPLDHLLCIFPFEEDYFRDRAVNATYIGHPLTRIVEPSQTRAAFCSQHHLDPNRPLLTLLCGSRPGEVARHWPIVKDAAARIAALLPAQFILATPAGFTSLTEPNARPYIQQIEGKTWDAIAHADLALAASGTVTIEAALLGTPLIAFYKVSPLSWWMGRYLVKVPFFSMVNLVAGRKVVPELIQDSCTGQRLAEEALRLLGDKDAQLEMRMNLGDVARRLGSDEDPIERAARIVAGVLAGTGR